MSKGQEREARYVLEPIGKVLVPAIYVRRWWWPWSWVRHSYLTNVEAKAKNKVKDLHRQLLDKFIEAEQAEKDLAGAVEEAQKGMHRGRGPVRMMKLGEPEDYVYTNPEDWAKLKPIGEALRSDRLTLSARRTPSGDTSAYILKGQEGAWSMEEKGKPALRAGIDHKITFRPPEDNKGKGKGNQQKGQQPGIQVIGINPSNKGDDDNTTN